MLELTYRLGAGAGVTVRTRVARLSASLLSGMKLLGSTITWILRSQPTALLDGGAAHVLKEGRPLVAVVRETPLHAGHLRQMLALAEIGGILLPPMPAFYQRPKSIDDLVNHTVARILDRMGIARGLIPEWTGTGRGGRSPADSVDET